MIYKDLSSKSDNKNAERIDLLRKALFASEAEELREAFATGLMMFRRKFILFVMSKKKCYYTYSVVS
jgi:hypothetical protein